MKIPLRVLPRSEYPVEPGLYLWRRDTGETESVKCSGDVYWSDGDLWVDDELPDGIAWSERIECEVIG